MTVSREEWMKLEAGFLAGLRMGSVAVPQLLLTSYAKLDLSEADAMLLIHLISFMEKEKKEFPTMDEIQDRMSVSGEKVIETLQKLMREGLINIDEDTDPISGIRFERYNLDGLWQKLAAVWAMEARSNGGAGIATAPRSGEQERSDLYSLFEKEFARPLTPMELETITGWLDQDRYPEELILMALKEAVFAGKIHFRYIDRILMEWRRNKVYTTEQAKEHTGRFRGAGR